MILLMRINSLPITRRSPLGHIGGTLISVALGIGLLCRAQQGGAFVPIAYGETEVQAIHVYLPLAVARASHVELFRTPTPTLVMNTATMTASPAPTITPTPRVSETVVAPLLVPTVGLPSVRPDPLRSVVHSCNKLQSEDSGPDGSVDAVRKYAFDEMGRLHHTWLDRDADGAWDFMSWSEFVGSTPTKRFDDNDGDGVADEQLVTELDSSGRPLRRERLSIADGVTISLEHYVYRDGLGIAELQLDSDADGTIDRWWMYQFEGEKLVQHLSGDDGDTPSLPELQVDYSWDAELLTRESIEVAGVNIVIRQFEYGSKSELVRVRSEFTGGVGENAIENFHYDPASGLLTRFEYFVGEGLEVVDEFEYDDSRRLSRLLRWDRGAGSLFQIEYLCDE